VQRTRDWRGFAKQAVADLWLREVRWLLVYWVVLFALLRYPFHNYQVFLDTESKAEPLFASPLFVGCLYALLNLAAAPLSRKVPWLVERFGRRVLFWGMPLMLCFSMLAMAWSATAALEQPETARVFAWVGVAMFFLQQIPFGMHWALVQEFVNHRIQPEARSTVWSVLSLGGRLCYSPVNQALFAVQQAQGLPLAMFLCGSVGAVLTAFTLWFRPRGLLRGSNVSGPGR
jgi:MFS family permease